ncbi:MAG: type 4a pilus biogenesis protein PilO [Candidatus Paceibacteria bacterium]
MRTALPILFIIIAGGIFFGFIDPAFDRVQALRAEEAKFDQALTRSRELQEVRDQLLSRYNTFSPADIERLERLLPDNVDNVRMVLDFDALASQYGMRLRNIALSTDEGRAERGQVGASGEAYQSVVLSFSVTGSYDAFRSFLEDLEQSLRLVDVSAISFSAAQSGLYDYSVSVKTYWLKP